MFVDILWHFQNCTCTGVILGCIVPPNPFKVKYVANLLLKHYGSEWGNFHILFLFLTIIQDATNIEDETKDELGTYYIDLRPNILKSCLRSFINNKPIIRTYLDILLRDNFHFHFKNWSFELLFHQYSENTVRKLLFTVNFPNMYSGYLLTLFAKNFHLTIQ